MNSTKATTLSGEREGDCELAAVVTVGRSHNKYQSENQANGDDESSGLPHDFRWDHMFDRLVAFKEGYGHCLVPNRHKEDPKLGAWVSTQRRQYKALQEGRFNTTTLSSHRIEKLDDIGFVWNTSDPRRVEWGVRFQELAAFHRKHGHCLVPMGYKANLALANWVSVQRQEYNSLKQQKSTKMTRERISLLNTLDFVWKAPRGARPKLQSSKHGGSANGTSALEQLEKQQEAIKDDSSEHYRYSHTLAAQSMAAMPKDDAASFRSLLSNTKSTNRNAHGCLPSLMSLPPRQAVYNSIAYARNPFLFPLRTGVPLSGMDCQPQPTFAPPSSLLLQETALLSNLQHHPLLGHVAIGPSSISEAVSRHQQQAKLHLHQSLLHRAILEETLTRTGSITW